MPDLTNFKALIVFTYTRNKFDPSASETDAKGDLRLIFLDLVGLIRDTTAINSALYYWSYKPIHVASFAPFPNIQILSFAVDMQASVIRINEQKRSHILSTFLCEKRRGAPCGLLDDLRNTIHLPCYHPQRHLKSPNDPCRVCFVTPDHLLTGFLRGCINIEYELLPLRDYTKSANCP